MFITLTIHSITRWLVVLAGVITIVFLLQEINAKDHIFRKAKIAFVSYAHLMTFQALLGLGVYQQMKDVIPLQRYDFEHIGIMVLAAIVANVPQFLKKLPNEKYKKIALYATIASMVLVFAGVMSLGFARWIHIHGIF